MHGFAGYGAKNERERIAVVAIRREGFAYIVVLAISATLLSVASAIYPNVLLQLLTIITWILVLLVINFFRDPERKVPADADCIIAPADGKVIDVRMVREDSYLHAEVSRVSIFMSVFDVHVNRAPLDGRLAFTDYHQGRFVAAFREDASGENEHLSIGFLANIRDGRLDGDHKVMIKLIAGYLARRILLFKQVQDEVLRGERIGMIKFGSRVEVYLPAEWEVVIQRGQRVRAGETVVGRLKKVK